MSAPPTITLVPKRTGLPFWTAMLGLIILIGAGVAVSGSIWFYHLREKARLDAKVQALETDKARARLERDRAAEEAKLTLARNRQTDLQAQARQATNVLARLLADTVKVQADALALRSNEAGRLIAQHPDLVASARRLYETDLPALATAADIASRLEAVRRVEQQVSSALGTTYVPESELVVTAQNSALWGEQESRRVALARNLLTALTQESKAKLPAPSSAPAPASLQDAINQMAQAESAQRQRLVLEKTEPAKVEAAVTLALAEAKRITDAAQADAKRKADDDRAAAARQEAETAARLAAAQAEAKRIVDQATAEAKRLQAETAAKIDESLRQTQIKIDKMNAEIASKEAEQKRLAAIVQANQQHSNIVNNLTTTKIIEDAHNLELKQKASGAAVRMKLAPFTTLGHWQIKTISVEREPLSLTAIHNTGALNPDVKGMHQLFLIASDTRDKERPRWRWPNANWFLRPERVEMVAEVQKLLVELGPVLVEMGMLRP